MKRSNGESGSSLIESAMLLPLLFLLLFGMVELARISYTYYALNKILTTVASYVGSRQAVNFCDDGDATVAIAKTFAITGGNDPAAAPLVPNLEATNIRIGIERYDATSDSIATCECSATGCDLAQGGRAPSYVVVSLADGYPVRLAVPFVNFEPIILRPQIRMPYAGT
jgi:Flp pilus assembly protein TadG